MCNTDVEGVKSNKEVPSKRCFCFGDDLSLHHMKQIMRCSGLIEVTACFLKLIVLVKNFANWHETVYFNCWLILFKLSNFLKKKTTRT